MGKKFRVQQTGKILKLKFLVQDLLALTISIGQKDLRVCKLKAYH